MTVKEGIIAVPDATGRVGCMTWWRTSAITNFDRLKAEWLKNDLDEAELPSLPGDNAALNRALRSCFQERHCLVRVLPDGVYAVVDEDVRNAGKGDDPDYAVRFKVWIDYDELEIQFDREVDEDIADSVFEHFEKARRELTTADMSSWFVRRAHALSAIGLRDTGGIYFIPETGAPKWSAFADIIAKVSETRIFEIPALKTNRAVEAIMDAVIAETQAEVKALTDLLDTKEFSERGLRSKGKRCDELAAKLRSYEDLLGVKMAAMQDAIEEVDGRVTDMIMALAAEEE